MRLNNHELLNKLIIKFKIIKSKIYQLLCKFVYKIFEMGLLTWTPCVSALRPARHAHYINETHINSWQSANSPCT